MQFNMKLLRLSEVRSRIPLSRASIYRKISTGEFPRPYNLGGHAVAWLESDIQGWIAERVAAGQAQDGSQCL